MGTYTIQGGTFSKSAIGDGATVYNGAEQEIFDIISNAELSFDEKRELISHLDAIKKGAKDTKSKKLIEFLKGFGINLTAGVIANYLTAKGL